MTTLETQFNEGKLTDTESLTKLVKMLIEERDSWKFNANALQKAYNALDVKLNECQKLLQEEIKKWASDFI